MPAKNEWTHPVVVAKLPERGTEFRLVPDAAARAELAKFVGVSAVPQLSAILHVKPDTAGGALVEGSLEAKVTQKCGVTLENFDNDISEQISARFVPENSPLANAGDIDLDIESEPPDQLTNGALNLAAIVAEFLALGVDPYPRKPGVVFEAPEAGDRPSAFAALEQLKRGKGEGKS